MGRPVADALTDKDGRVRFEGLKLEEGEIVETERASYMTGATIDVTGGMLMR